MTRISWLRTFVTNFDVLRFIFATTLWFYFQLRNEVDIKSSIEIIDSKNSDSKSIHFMHWKKMLFTTITFNVVPYLLYCCVLNRKTFLFLLISAELSIWFRRKISRSKKNLINEIFVLRMSSFSFESFLSVSAFIRKQFRNKNEKKVVSKLFKCENWKAHLSDEWH